MSQRPSLATVLAVAALVLLSGCTPIHHGTERTATTKPSATSTATIVPHPTEADTGHDENPGPAPADAATDAAQVAVAAMAAFSRPTLNAADWFAGLAPYLTDQGKAWYKSADPSRIPATAVTGPASGATGDLVSWATVTVPTDAGAYTVNLARPDAAHPWQVLMIMDPKGRT